MDKYHVVRPYIGIMFIYQMSHDTCYNMDEP